MNKNLLKSLSPISAVTLIVGGGIASTLILSSCVSRTTPTLSISTDTKSANAFEQVNIIGSFEFHKFSTNSLVLWGADAQYFKDFTPDYETKTFTVNLPNDVAGNRDYILQLEDTNTEIVSNPVSITINPIALSDVGVGCNLKNRTIEFNTSLTPQYIKENIFVESGWSFVLLVDTSSRYICIANYNPNTSYYGYIDVHHSGPFLALNGYQWKTSWDDSPYYQFDNSDYAVAQITNVSNLGTFPSVAQRNLLKQLAIIY